MKSPSLLVLAALASAGVALGQATTMPVGYTSYSLKPGFNFVALTLHNSSVSTGIIDAVSGTTITDNQLAITPQVGRLYVIEITQSTIPALVGSISEIASSNINGSNIVSNDDLGALGLAAGDKYNLRAVPTLEEIFTTTPLASGGVLDAAISSGSADVLWLPDGNGGFTKYFLRSGATPHFRNVATNLASPNIPIVYVDGIIIEKRNVTASTLTVSGEVKPIGTNSVLSNGYNLASIVAPTGLNLFNAGLEDNLKVALSAGSADLVWVQNSDGSITKYFRRSGTGAGWRVEGSTTTLTQVQAEAVTLSGSIMIQRRDPGSVALTLNAPASYVSLVSGN